MTYLLTGKGTKEKNRGGEGIVKEKVFYISVTDFMSRHNIRSVADFCYTKPVLSFTCVLRVNSKNRLYRRITFVPTELDLTMCLNLHTGFLSKSTSCAKVK